MPKKKVVSQKPTDHTPALLVSLAYLIGFLTAYIAFGLNNYSPAEYTKKPPVVNEAVAYNAVRAVTTNEGLFWSDDEQQRIISAKQSDGSLSFGYHREIITTSVSPNNSMIHYCAVMEDNDSCAHFVYTAEEDKVYPVMSNDTHLYTTKAMALEAYWSMDNILHIGAESSESTKGPWVMK